MTERTRFPVGFVIVALLLGGVVATTWAMDSIADRKVVRWVEKTVAERQPTAEDNRFHEIAWVADIRTAIKLGKEYNRPIFFFAGDGRINTGRC
jgi:hypothetical protein